jgi:DNA-binding transcriptional regulator YiaG
MTKKTKKPARRAGEPVAATCSDCGGPLTSSREAHRFPLFGDLYATLEDIEILSCPKCGYRSVGIEQPEALARTVVAAIAHKRARLAADEIAYLRSFLDLSGAELGQAIGVTKGTVSRWENAHEKIGVTPDRLLRALALLQLGESEPAAFFVTLEQDDKDAVPIRLTLRRAGGAWQVAKAA